MPLAIIAFSDSLKSAGDSAISCKSSWQLGSAPLSRCLCLYPNCIPCRCPTRQCHNTLNIVLARLANSFLDVSSFSTSPPNPRHPGLLFRYQPERIATHKHMSPTFPAASERSCIHQFQRCQGTDVSHPILDAFPAFPHWELLSARTWSRHKKHDANPALKEAAVARGPQRAAPS